MKNNVLISLAVIVLVIILMNYRKSGFGECALKPNGTPHLINKNVPCDRLFPGMGYVDGPISGDKKQCCKP
jgi:hypothetical protein